MGFDFGIVWAHADVLLAGVALTIGLALVSILAGTCLGIGVALAKNSPNPLFRKAVTWYADFFRLMPVLVLLVWVYYALPILSGIRLGGFETAALVLSFHLSAYVGELFFSGLAAIPKGQIETARLSGMTELQILWHISLPQVARQLLSPLMGLYIETAKNTTLAAIIALPEFLHQGQVLNSIYFRPLEVYTVIALAFLVMLWPLAALARKFEYAAFSKKLKGESR